jgi:DNA-binding CsgD family transcriptional regulator
LLEQLDVEFAEADSGRLRVVLLVGEAGVGKTRLASEFVARHDPSVVSLSARAYPLGATASLGLWVEALERSLRPMPTDEVLELCAGNVEDLATLLPSVRAACSSMGIPSPPDAPPRIRLLGALASVLDRLSQRSVVVVTLDDVHLGDGSSWEALNYLTRNLVDSRVLVVLVARPNELAEHAAAGEVVRALEQEGLLTALPVAPLSRDEVRQLAAAMVGSVPDALVEWLAQRAEGSPLFVTGLVRALLDEGADLAHPSLTALPEDLAARVEARLENLDGFARATIELLAVIEHRAELRDLLRLTGQSIDDLAELLERLQRVRLVTELEAGRELLYEIAHPLIQEAIYRQIGGARRRALHRRAARALVERGQYGAAASHVVRAADPGDEEAVDTLREALRLAEAGEHHREALALLGALVEMLPPGDRRWLDVIEVMPLTPDWIVDHRADASSEVGVRAMRRADQVLERFADAERRAAVKFSLGILLAWGLAELPAGRELVERARELFAEAGDRRGALVATNELGYHAAFTDDLETHERLAREVLAAAEADDDPVIQLQALCSLAWALLTSGRVEAVLEVVDRGVVIAQKADKTYRLCYLLGMRASVEHLLGRSQDTSLLDVAKEVHAAYRDTMLLDFAGQIAWESGNLQGCVAARIDQMAWDGRPSNRRAFGAAVAVLSLAEQGRHDDALAVQSGAASVFRGRHCWVLSRVLEWSAAVNTVLSGQRTDGLGQLAAAAEGTVGAGYWSWGRWMLVDLAEAAVLAEEPAMAARAAQLLDGDPWPPAGPSHDGARAFVAGAAAMTAGPNGRPEAVRLLDEAVLAFRTAGWVLLEGRALELLGVALAGFDRARAVEVWEAAATRFATCEAAVRRDRVVDRLAGLGSTGRRKRATLLGPGSLSTREREVAVLASQGCSAREIARRLFIGERTVETHLANVYAKLGVSSKVELIRRAAELGL